MNESTRLLLFALAVIAIVFTFACTFLFLMVVRPWLRALGHGTPVSMVSIIGMRLRGNPPVLLIDAYIALHRASVATTIADVENTYIDNRTRVRNSEDLVHFVKSKTATS
jgi:uncharacterized protein YqfA (UPF0365 family)